jgi:hypothetical protein
MRIHIIIALITLAFVNTVTVAMPLRILELRDDSESDADYWAHQEDTETYYWEVES